MENIVNLNTKHGYLGHFITEVDEENTGIRTWKLGCVKYQIILTHPDEFRIEY